MKHFVALGIVSQLLTGCAYSLASPSGGGNTWGANQTVHSTNVYNLGKRTLVESGFGAETFVSGNLVEAGTAFGGNLQKEVSLRGAYKPALRASLGISYEVTPNTAVTARGFAKRAKGEDSPITFETDALGAVTQSGTVSDFVSYGGEVGARRYLADRDSRFRTYIGASGGLEYVEEIRAQGFAGNQNLYDGGWTPTASALTGVDYALSPMSTVSFETGVRWAGQMNGNEGSNFRLGGDRLSLPVTLRGSFRF